MSMTTQEVRHLRMQAALAGYRGQPENNPLPPGPERDQVHQAYEAGRHRLAVKQSTETPAPAGESFICSKAGDRFCKAVVALGGFYVLWLVGQAIHYWAVMR